MFRLLAGGAGIQIFTPETINLMLAANPTLLAFDAPAPMNPGWEDARCWRFYPIPFSYVAPFLARSLSPREAFILVFQTATSLG
jgi:hypothetical protein